MDTEILNILGPYADLQKVKPINRFNSKQPAANSIKTHVDFEQFHKKPGLKFIRGIESKRTTRLSVMEQNRKDKRTETLMSKRNVIRETSPLSDVDEISSNNEQISKSSATLNKNVKASAADIRKQQLQQYKQTKQETAKNTIIAKRVPFKAGGVNVGVPKNGVPPPPALDNNRSRFLASKIGFVSSNPQNGNINHAKTEAERRVTRAMTKGQTNPVDRTKPAITQMKNLSLNGSKGDKSQQNKVPVPANIIKPQIKKPLLPRLVVPSFTKLAKKDTVKQLPNTNIQDPTNKTSVKEPQPPIQAINVLTTTNAAPPVGTAKPKPVKPKAIDAVYAEKNFVFAKACEKLTGFSTYWRNVYNTTPNIPEDIRDQIDSALGNVTLLLGSKLPQFTQLLFSYICQEKEPTPVLECDLQGWWDVAVLQVDQVSSKFAELKEIEKNNWIKQVKENTPIKVLKKKKNPVSSKVVIKPQTSGFQNFLKAKKAGQSNTSLSQKVELANNDAEAEKLPRDNTFLGGFFVIQSPAKSKIAVTPIQRQLRSSARFSQTGLKTPASTSRLSNNSSATCLRILSMRKSMGSLYRMGVQRTPLSNSEELNEIDPIRNFAREALSEKMDTTLDD